jgi:hypothetical protein
MTGGWLSRPHRIGSRQAVAHAVIGVGRSAPCPIGRSQAVGRGVAEGGGIGLNGKRPPFSVMHHAERSNESNLIMRTVTGKPNSKGIVPFFLPFSLLLLLPLFFGFP